MRTDKHTTAGQAAWISCLEIEANTLQQGWDLSKPIFAVVIVLQGQLSILYNHEQLCLSNGDIHCYAPGMPSRMLGVSDDYKGLYLSVDEHAIQDTSLAEHFVRSAYLPIAKHHQPQAHLSHQELELLSDILRSIRSHIHYDSPQQRRNLVALCEVFGSNLNQIFSSESSARQLNDHSEELFFGFVDLVAKHYLKERSLAFYAQRLSITSTYLSRIVRRFSGRTAMSFISYALWSKAAEELSTSTISINELAYQLGFADQSSFSKFFSRIYGASPSSYREDIQKPKSVIYES